MQAPFNRGGWKEVRLDIDPSVQPNVVGSITDMHMLDRADFDVVFSSHNLEHLYPHDIPVALCEIHRVLLDDGFLVVTCPDLKAAATLIVENRLEEAAYQSPAGPISPADILFGHRASMAAGNLHMAHRYGFTEHSLRQHLEAGGFATMVMMNRPSALDLWTVAFKSPRTQVEALDIAQQFLPSVRLV